MRPFFGTYYPWQFTGTGYRHSFMQVYRLKKGVEMVLPEGEGFIILLVPEGPFRIKADGQIIRPKGHLSALCMHHQRSVLILTECHDSMILHFDASYITMSHPPELMNMYGRWKDLEEEQHMVLTPQVYDFCAHMMAGIQYAGQIESKQPRYYGIKILDLLTVQLHESSKLIEKYSDEKRRAKALVFEYLGLVRLHYADYWNMEQYAKSLTISKDYLHQLCSRYLGKTPSDVVYDKQLIEAQILLKNTPYSIKEIAHRLKFEDQNYFTRFFSKRAGMTPSDFRAKVKLMQTTSDQGRSE